MYEAKEYTPTTTPTKKKATPQPLTLEQQFLKGIELASLCSMKRASLPILECGYFSGDSITTTDLEMALKVKLPFLPIDPVCLPMSMLKNVLKSLNEPLDMDIDNEKHLATINGAIMQGFDPAEFPDCTVKPLPTDAVTFTIPERWGHVMTAGSGDLSRPHLHALYLDFSKGALVASDGHRAHVLQMPKVDLPNTLVSLEAAKIIQKLMKVEPQAKATIVTGTPTLLRLEGQTFSFSCRTVDQEFPDYPQVTTINKYWPQFVINRKVFLEAAKACLPATTDRSRGIRFDYTAEPRTITLTVENPDVASIKRTIPITLKASVSPLPPAWGLNAAYLIEALNAFSEETVNWHLIKEDMATHFTSEAGTFQATIMTMRIF